MSVSSLCYAMSDFSASIASPLCLSVPDRRSRILEVVIVRRLVTWVLGIWSGEGMGKGGEGLKKGRSVHE